jgi:hypothetical protein
MKKKIVYRDAAEKANACRLAVRAIPGFLSQLLRVVGAL